MKIGDKIDVVGFGRWNKARTGSRGYRGIEVLRGTVTRLWPHKVAVLVGTMTLIFRVSDGHEINFNGRRVSGFRIADIITLKGSYEDSANLAGRNDDCRPSTAEQPADSTPDENRGKIG